MRVSQILTNETLNRGFTIESNGDPNAKASTSTATGLGQYLNQSWLGVLYTYGPVNLARRIRKTGNPKKPFSVPDGGERAILDMRKAAGKPELLKLNIDMFARDWEGHTKVLGKGWGEGDLYLCHFLGPGTAKKLLHADPNATAVSVCGQAAADANPTIFWAYVNKVRGRAKTCGELRSWAANAMRTRWDNRGRPDWVGKYYPKQDHPEPEPEPIEVTHDEKPPMKLDIHERDDAGEDAPKDAPAEVPAEAPEPAEAPKPEPVPLPRPAPSRLPAPPSGYTVKGDPEVWWVQYRLKQMHYYGAVLDGGYGGRVAGAVAGFLNDRHEPLSAPTSVESFDVILPELKLALTSAESEGFERPVSQARKEAAPEVLDEVAPDAKPVKRNFIMGLLASAGASITAIFNGLKDSVSDAWSFFFDHKDDIPDEVTDQATSWLGSVPGWVWLAGAATIFLLFALNSGSALKKIIDKVKTGER
jgi:hypothetical protein